MEKIELPPEKILSRLDPKNFNNKKIAAGFLMKFVKGEKFEDLPEERQQKVRDIIEWLQD